MRMTDIGLNGRGGLTRILALALAASMLFALAVPLTAGGVMPLWPETVPMDVYEPDNIPGDAGYIPVNAPPQPHTIHEWTDEDWTQFDAVAGRTYLIEVKYPGTTVVGDYDAYPPVDTWLELYAADGTTLLESEYYDPFFFIGPPRPTGYGSTIIWEATETGPLFVRSTSWINGDGGIGYITADDGGTARSTETDFSIGFNPEKGQYLLSVSSGTGMITGKVTAEDTGGPLEGVTIYAWRMDGVSPAGEPADASVLGGPSRYPPGTFTTTTAADGTYALRNLPAGTYDIHAWPMDSCIPYASTDSCRYVPLADGETLTDVDFELVAAGIQGKVTNSAGDPLRDIYVYIDAVGSSWSGSTYTNEAGCYTYPGSILPTGTQFTLRFSEQNPNPMYQPEWYDDAVLEASATPVPVAGPWDGTNAALGIDAVLDMMPVAFTGKVTDMSGAPLGNHPVYAYSQAPAPPNIYQTQTAPDGTYTMRMDASGPVTQTVTVWFADGADNDHVSEWWEDETNPASATPLPIKQGVPVSNVDAALMEMPPYLVGTVTDDETGDPIKGVECWLYEWNMYGNSWDIKDYVRTGKDGTYAFPGYAQMGTPYRLRFYDPAETYATEYWRDQATLAEADDIYLFGSGPPPGGSATLTDVGVPMATVADAELGLKVPRSTGEDRYIASVNVARDQFPDWEEIGDVIVAAGEDEAAADALSAAGLSWLYDAPVLLASKNGVSNEVLQAIADMGPDVTLHVAGGPNSLPDSVVAQITALSNVDDTADRIAGKDRFETSVAIAERVDAMAGGARVSDAVLVANGADWSKFFDALALSAPCASTGLPILLVQEDNIPASTAAYLDNREPDDIFIAGGPATVSPGVMTDLIGTGAIVQRWWGADRYGTAVAVANGSIGRSWIGLNTVGVAAKVPDAMSGGAAIGRQDGPLILTGTDVLPDATEQFLSINKAGINSCTVFGGPASVSEDVRDQIAVTLH